MAAARTIPDTQKRRTCIALIMSYKIVVTATLRRHRRTAEAKEVLRPEPVRMFALRIAGMHLRTTHLHSYLNLLNSARRINSDLTLARTACRTQTWSGRPSPWLVDAHLCAV